LAGGGNTAHIFDDFAPRLTAHFHVYGITRRGFGASGFSAADSGEDRLGEDVIAVLDSLKLKHPVLAGHSIAGAEMSTVANSHPQRVAGLVYLDAAYSYAFDNDKGASAKEMQDLSAPQPPPPGSADLASFAALQKYFQGVDGFQIPEAELRQQRKEAPGGAVGAQRNPPGGAMLMSVVLSPKKYNKIPAKALIIFANPHGLGKWVNENKDPAVISAARVYSSALGALVDRQQKAVQDGVPAAHVVVLPGANHYVFLSNQAEVLREMRVFITGIP
jgi:pimeloyl-ACP methyl ester carboxylesterase